MNLYECMFLIDAGRANRAWEETEQELTKILGKHGGEVRRHSVYGERKLAYPVDGSRRGVYLLTYFEMDPDAIEELRVDLSLSEAALRYLILRVDGDLPDERPLGTAEPVTHFGREEPPAEEEKPAEEPEAEEEKPAEEPPAEEEKPTEEPEAEEEKPTEEPEAEAAEAPAEPEAPAEDAGEADVEKES
jgi:small subunit ribosomal protein S6